jgi:DNA-directed RNA polymerase specialized sigma24 family protein
MPVRRKWCQDSTVKVAAKAVHQYWPLLEQFYDLSEEDVLNEILVKLQRIEPKFKADRSKWESYVWRTSRCTILDLSKVRTRQAKRDAKYMGVWSHQGVEVEDPDDDSPNVHGEVVEGEVVCSTDDDGHTLFEWVRTHYVQAKRACGDAKLAQQTMAGMLMLRMGIGPPECRRLFLDRRDIRLAVDLSEQHVVPSLKWFAEGQAAVAAAADSLRQE